MDAGPEPSVWDLAVILRSGSAVMAPGPRMIRLQVKLFASPLASIEMSTRLTDAQPTLLDQAMPGPLPCPRTDNTLLVSVKMAVSKSGI